MHEKYKRFQLMIQNGIAGTYRKALRLTGNEPVTSRVRWQWSSWPSPSLLSSWPSPSSYISCCFPPYKAVLSLSRGLPRRSILLCVGWWGISADLPAGLGADMVGLESSCVCLGDPVSVCGVQVNA